MLGVDSALKIYQNILLKYYNMDMYPIGTLSYDEDKADEYIVVDHKGDQAVYLLDLG